MLQIMATEVGENRRDHQEIDALLKRANYTEVHDMIKSQDNIYVHTDLRSTYFGDDQKPKLIRNP